jgi:uncharacterized membrane protein
MRVSRTLLAFAALLLVTACSAQHAEVVLPGDTPTHDSGTWIGSGNYVGPDSTSGSGGAAPGGSTYSGTWIGSGN